MLKPAITSISPFLIVSDVSRTISFYQERLGFACTHQQPADAPFFAILSRDEVQLLVKSQRDIIPLPNSGRHPFLRWDAYLYTPEPDVLAAELLCFGTAFSQPLGDTEDGLRGFEVTDPDGYVLFFGCPLPTSSATTSRNA